MDPHTPTFRDRHLDRQLREDGYVVVPFVGPDVLAEVREGYHRLSSGIGEGYYASMHSADADYKARADEIISSRFWPPLDALLVDHERVVGAYMVKHPGAGTTVPPHQDWIITDERVGHAINCWVPLTEITDEVGPMAVLPGSHRYLEGLRGSPSFPTEYGGIAERVHAELMQEVPVALGEAIIYDSRLLHATRPNLSDATRIVAYVSAINAGGKRLHYYRDDAGAVEAYEVGRDFFTTFSIGERPQGQLLERIEGYTIDDLSYEQLVARHRHHRRPSRSRWFRARR